MCTHILKDYSGYVIQTSITKSSHFTVCIEIGFKTIASAYYESIFRHIKLRGVTFSVNFGFYKTGAQNQLGVLIYVSYPHDKYIIYGLKYMILSAKSLKSTAIAELFF